MKYIRTGDGIHRVFRLLKNGYFLVKISKYKYCYAEPNCKQADTIEELIDECVIHYANGYRLITINNGEITFKDGFDYGFKLEFALENGYEIYGSICDDISLIKVAKMTKKGDWELL